MVPGDNPIAHRLDMVPPGLLEPCLDQATGADLPAGGRKDFERQRGWTGSGATMLIFMVSMVAYKGSGSVEGFALRTRLISGNARRASRA